MVKMKKEWNYPNSMDAVSAAPESHKVLLENEKVRVVEVIISQGRREPKHTHKWPSVMIVDKPAKIVYYNEKDKGRLISHNKNIKQPIVEWINPEKPHSVENIDVIPYHAIRIELKNQ